MKDLEYRFLDKSGLPEGPWKEEPDKCQWTDRATGLPCLAVRHPRSNHWCGYVGVSEGHPWFNVEHSDYRVAAAEVHGGVTYSDFCVEDNKNHGVCHLVEDGENDRVWWLGFDCAHSGDWAPYYRDKMARKCGTYKTIGYVKAQCARLAKQLKKAHQ